MISDIIQIASRARPKMMMAINRAPPPTNLRQSRDARTHGQAGVIAGQGCGKKGMIGDTVRARSHQRHLAAYHIDQLWQFIQPAYAQPSGKLV